MRSTSGQTRTSAVVGPPRGARLALGGGVLALGALLGWAIFAQRRVVIRGLSMRPLLESGDGLLVDRLAYRVGRPARGDVVLVHAPASTPPILVKLLVGLPSEEIRVARDRLWIDGRELDLGRPVIGSSPGQWTLGAEGYFVLSVNLAIGTDSRHSGPVERHALLGRGWLVYAPAARRRRLARPAVPMTLAPGGPHPPAPSP